MEGLRRFRKETEQEVGILTGISPNINAALFGLRFFVKFSNDENCWRKSIPHPFPSHSISNRDVLAIPLGWANRVDTERQKVG